MTTLTLNLTSTLQQSLTDTTPNGVWAYAVYFDANGLPHFTTLVDNGSLESGGVYDIELPQMGGGKIYFIVQSQDTANTNDLTSLLTGESTINWNNAAAWDFRYDSFEFSLLGSPGDAGNLTSVNGFGLPMDLSIAYPVSNAATQTRGYGISGSTLFSDLGQTASGVLTTYTSGALSGQTRMAISPTTSVGNNLTTYQASDWNAYLQSLEVASPGITISGFFNGAPDANNVYHNAAYFAYELSWDATHQNIDGTVGTFWLSPTEDSQVKGYIQITQDQLANSIYSTLGDAYIYTNQDDATPYTIAHSGSEAMNTGANTQWGTIFTQFLTGFSAGYFNVQGQSPNAGVTTPVNLNTNINWDPTYAFGHSLSGTATPVFMDPYSEVFFSNSNSYGSNYSDNLMSQYSQGGPLISLYDGTGNVGNINITIYDDSETPAGYTVPSIANYIPNATFEPVAANTNGLNIGLSFANQTMVLDESEASITFRFQTAEGVWSEVELSASANTITGSLWDVWTIVKNGDGTYSVSAAGSEQTTGSLLINNMPTPPSGAAWYQLVVHDTSDPDGTAASAKTYNLYTTTTDSSGTAQFVNPAYSAGALAIDGLALINVPSSAAATTNTFSLAFLYSGTSTVDPSLLTTNTDLADSALQPTSPMAGDMSTGTFTLLGGQDTTTDVAASSSSGVLAFGWTGVNPDFWWPTSENGTNGGPPPIASYTNKVGAENIARIFFSGVDGAFVKPVDAVADIDGQWTTPTVQMGNGVYTVNMREYLPESPGHATALTPLSSALTLTVSIPTLSLTQAGQSALLVDNTGHSDVHGNWIRFEASDAASGLPHDATLVLYATDADGNLIGRDGSVGAGVTLADATLAKVGSVFSDTGTNLLTGAQQLYLAAGQQLHFAVQSGSGTIDMAPDVQVTTDGSNAATVDVGGFMLTAETLNDLSAAANVAASQRESDQPLLYLSHGDELKLEITGSGANTNSLGFVHLDMDAAGGWSVDGVAYGDTPEFKAALTSHLDGDLTIVRGGDTAFETTWTVAGDDGYYAPVLLTQNGDILFIGNENVGGHEYIRMYGENTFAFEDLTSEQNSDFDYNDMVMKITPVDHII